MSSRNTNIFHFVGLVGFLLGISLTILSWINSHDFADLTKPLVSGSYFFGLVAMLSLYVTKVTVKKQELAKKDAEDSSEKNDNAIDYSSLSKNLGTIHQSDEDNKTKSDKILRAICNGLNASQGALYKYLDDDKKAKLELYSSYAFIPSQTEQDYVFDAESDLIGLAVKEDRKIELNEIPRANFKVFSGLGKTSNASVVIIPVREDEEVKGAIELSFFGKQDKGIQRFIHDNMSKIGSLL